MALLAVVVAIVGLPAWLFLPSGDAGLAAPVAPDVSSRYVPETGHNVAEPFLSRWQAAGGEEVLGPPLSEERYVEGAGGVLQTFAALTLIYDPAQDPPQDVRGVALPEDVRAALAPAAARARVAGCGSSEACRFFPESGHTLGGSLRSFWEAHGELTVFGPPASEPFVDADGVTAQLFERGVLEVTVGGRVRARPIMADEASAGGLGDDPAFQPAPPTNGVAWRVSSADGLRLRAGPSLDADVITLLPDDAEVLVAAGGGGDWVPGYADGHAGWVSSEFLRPSPAGLPVAKAWDSALWQGVTLSETNVRTAPSSTATLAGVLPEGTAVTVEAWVAGEEVDGDGIWARLGAARFVYSHFLMRTGPVAPPPVPADAPVDGKWIDVNLTQQLMTAYEGRTAVRTALTSSGRPAWETPPGTYQILVRVGNETMESGSIGAEHDYTLKDVLFTQYFTDRGHAIHFGWWKTPENIGRPTSHGCLNLLLPDARFFWAWAEVGTTVDIHP